MFEDIENKLVMDCTGEWEGFWETEDGCICRVFEYSEGGVDFMLFTDEGVEIESALYLAPGDTERDDWEYYSQCTMKTFNEMLDASGVTLERRLTSNAWDDELMEFFMLD